MAVWLPKPSVFSVTIAGVGWFLQDTWGILGQSLERENHQQSVLVGVCKALSCRECPQSRSQIWIEALDRCDAVRKVEGGGLSSFKVNNLHKSRHQTPALGGETPDLQPCHCGMFDCAWKAWSMTWRKL